MMARASGSDRREWGSAYGARSDGRRVAEHRSACAATLLSRPVIALACLASFACGEPWPAPPPVDAEAFLAEHEEWRTNRERNLVTPPGGPVLWVGLYELAQGATPFGSDPSHPIALPPEDTPPLAGTLHREGQSVHLEPAPGSPVALRGGDRISEPMALGSDRSGNTTDLALGSLGLRIHGEPGTDRLWLRVWDEDLPLRETFELPEYFAVADGWRVQARFEPYDEPRPLRVADVTGGTVEYEAPGELVFEVDGREHSLIATGSPTSTSYFVMMWDSTAVSDTYQGGRYLRVPVQDESGWTTIDFNRAYNAPCVFTAYSVCALPPRENWLALHVTAGEKRPDEPAY
ncbi:MAG TPA: DUF1684 domain-containing protein [Longimicrobiales bacterium]|nr:DUF1684 domain-containing protein [Longimicrobiales bacterium]